MPKYRVSVLTETDYIIDAENENVDFWEMIGDGDYLSIKYVEEQITNIEEMKKETKDTDNKLEALVTELVKRNISTSDATNFDLRISKESAENLLLNPIPNFNYSIMCKEYGTDSDWVGIEFDDLYENGRLDAEYKTFEIWIS